VGSILNILLAASAAFYTLAAVAHLFNMFRRDWEFFARWSTRLAWAVHTAGLVLVVLETRQVPLYTLFEFAFFFSWFVMSNYLVIEVWRHNQAAGAFLLPVIAGVQVATVSLPKPTATDILINELPASLIGWHIGLIMLGYAFFFASFVAGCLYLLQERNLRRKRWGPFYHKVASLETLDIWGARFVYMGFPLLTIGTISGMGFAHVTWDTFWQSDPKVIFTVIVWLVYAGHILMRKLRGWGGRRLAWWSVAGVIGVLINHFIVNLLSGLHRFGV
jgi:cytochrome c-type biogenesis protein CcsB